MYHIKSIIKINFRELLHKIHIFGLNIFSINIFSDEWIDQATNVQLYPYCSDVTTETFPWQPAQKISSPMKSGKTLCSNIPKVLRKPFPQKMFLCTFATCRFKTQSKLEFSKHKNQHRDAGDYLGSSSHPQLVPMTPASPTNQIAPSGSYDSCTCIVCHKKFDFQQELSYHMTSHKVENHYMCNVCGKRIRVRSNFLAHINTHYNYQPFQCRKCEHKFFYKHTLKRHEAFCIFGKIRERANKMQTPL